MGKRKVERAVRRGFPTLCSAVLCAGLLSPALVTAGAGAPAAGVIVRNAVAHDVSLPLAEVPPHLGEVVAEGPLAELGIEPLEELGGEGPEPKFPEATTSDPVVQTTTSETAPMPGPIVNVPGLGSQDTANTVYKGLLSVSPPDPTGAAGPDHYFQWVNNVFAVFDKSGKRVYGPAAGNTMFEGLEPCAHSNAGDPIVLYDSLAGRFVVSQLAFLVPATGAPPSWQCVAVSTTSNPLGTWSRYAFLIEETALNDYPKMGVWNDAYYTTFNMFTGGLLFTHTRVCAFERDAMLAGAAARQVCLDPDDENAFALLPADADGVAPPSGAPNYLLNVESGRRYADDGLAIWEFHVDWTAPTESSLKKATTLATEGFIDRFCSSNDCIPQRGTNQGLDPMDDRPMFRLQYRNFGDHESMVVNHTVLGDRNIGIRWYEMRKSGTGQWSIAQQGTFSPDDGVDRFMGSVAMDRDGNMALGYSVSSFGINPSIWYAGRLASDAPGTLGRGERVLYNGSASQTSSSRWGDYTHMSIDPEDGCTFWYTGEYVDGSSFGWRTRIGSFRFPSCEGA